MKRMTLHMTFAAAALAWTAATASAQTVKVEIPFAFQTSNARMLPGTYNVYVSHSLNGRTAVELRNTDYNRTIMALPYAGGAPPAKWTETGKAVVEFACAGGKCALSRIWTGDGEAYAFYAPKPKNGEVVAMVLIHSDRSE